MPEIPIPETTPSPEGVSRVLAELAAVDRNYRDTRDHLERLLDTRATLTHAARDAGATFQAIATVLGVTRGTVQGILKSKP